MNIAVIGAGLIGKKRISSLQKSDNLIAVFDKNEHQAKKLAEKHSSLFTKSVDDIIKNKSIDTAIISVVNKFAAPIVIKMLKSGKNVLCEKPLGRTPDESLKILNAAKDSKKLIKTGFNHRFHPAVLKAKKLLDKKEIGTILNIRSVYGHGGRVGMEKEWRCSKELCGGGELIDQGVHVIDLCRWFTLSEVNQVYGKTFTSFWETDVEDNAFFNLEFKSGIYAQCHVSWTNWKNIFSFDIYGDKGYMRINGLGGSYGKESLEVGYRKEKGGLPLIKNYEFENNNDSWILEWAEFKQAIENGRDPIGNGYDGHIANTIINAIYKSNENNKPIAVI